MYIYIYIYIYPSYVLKYAVLTHRLHQLVEGSVHTVLTHYSTNNHQQLLSFHYLN